MDGTRRHPNTLSDIERQDLEAGQSAIYLATLRLDGFVSLDAGEIDGSVLTKRLKLGGERLFFNIDAEEGGSVKVAILDDSGKSLPGYSGDQAVDLTGDHVRRQVLWKNTGTIRKLAGQTVRLKIQLRNARLYSFWTE